MALEQCRGAALVGEAGWLAQRRVEAEEASVQELVERLVEAGFEALRRCLAGEEGLVLHLFFLAAKGLVL